MRDARNPFAVFHPLIAFSYLLAAAVFSMAVFHPVYAAIALLGALLTCIIVRGARDTGRLLAGTAALALLIAAFNLAFSATGSTELFRIGLRAFYLEALVFGLVVGCMFAAMFLWLAVWGALMDSESLLAVLGPVAPTVSLMVSQVMRLAPEFLRRGRAVWAVQAAALPAGGARIGRIGRIGRIRSRLRILTVVMSWGMEDGIVRSDAMRARGYDSGRPRTLYRRISFRARDGVLLAAIALLAIANAALMAVAVGQFAFYPRIPQLTVWWGYAPYLAFVLVPVALQIRERLLWR